MEIGDQMQNHKIETNSEPYMKMEAFHRIGVTFSQGIVIHRQSRKDIVLASSVSMFCPSGTKPQYFLGRFDALFSINDKYHGLKISYKFRQNGPLNT